MGSKATNQYRPVWGSWWGYRYKILPTNQQQPETPNWVLKNAKPFYPIKVNSSNFLRRKKDITESKQ